jgi:hypothetical protein
MHDYLGQHPDVYMSEEMKEPGFFNPDLRINLARRAATEERYLSLFASANGAKRIGESSTWYMYSKKAATLINEWDVAAKAIVMIRNPVDAAYSLHGQLLWSCNEDIADFEEAIAAEEDRRVGLRIPAECTSPDGLQYTAVFTYTPQIRRFFDALGRDRVKVIVFEDFTRDTPAVFAETLRFLDLDPSFVPDFEVVNAAKPVAPAFNRFFAKRPGLRNAVHKLVPAGVQRKLIDAIPYFTRTIKRPKMLDPEIRRRLIPRFRDDIKALSELLGRDFTHWSSG